MQGKSQKGSYTILVISIIVALLILLVFWLTTTDLFTSDKDLLVKEAGKVTVSAFKEDCEYFSLPELIEKEKELKDKQCAYRAVIEDIEYNTYGDCVVYARAKLAEEDEDKVNKEKLFQLTKDGAYYFYIKVSVKDKKDINAALKDVVDIYGYVGKLTEYNSVTTLEVDGEAIMKVDLTTNK